MNNEGMLDTDSLEWKAYAATRDLFNALEGNAKAACAKFNQGAQQQAAYMDAQLHGGRAQRVKAAMDVLWAELQHAQKV